MKGDMVPSAGFVGRDAELGVLLGSLTRALEGNGSTVLLVGEELRLPKYQHASLLRPAAFALFEGRIDEGQRLLRQACAPTVGDRAQD